MKLHPISSTQARLYLTIKSFSELLGFSIREREAKEFGKGLNSKVKLDVYRRFSGKREFKKYLHGHSDEGARR